MTAYLLAVEVGPVAEFIQAARKTRDLWFGSWLVSEIAKAAAKAVADACGGHEALVFPAPASADLLDRGLDLTVADVILAETPPGTDPATVAAAAKGAVHAEWLRHARQARDRARHQVRDDVWLAQSPDAVPADTAGEVFECYAAWVARTGDYPDDRRRVMRRLAGRTACRNFPAAANRTHGHLWKSSLDGARETVLIDPPKGQDGRPTQPGERGLRLTRGEQLDAPGLTKRLAGGASLPGYPSVSRVALDPWVRGVSGRAPAEFAALVAECERLAAAGTLSRIDRTRTPHYGPFPFEGTAGYPSRYHELAEEARDSADAAALFRELTGTLGGRVAALNKALGLPREVDPYYAVLVADGDNVGRALNDRRDPAAHRDFSRALDRFADDARKLIGESHGVPVFVGGDDVLAFVPVDKVAECAAGLNTRFAAVQPDANLTLSVGVAIAHFLDPLEDVLETARAAEGHAKETKAALAVTLRTRGGAPVQVRWAWGEDPAGVLDRWAGMLEGGDVADKAAYDLRTLAGGYTTDAWPADDRTADAVRKDAARLLSAKGAGTRGAFTDALAGVRTADDLFKVAETVLIARRVRAARRPLRGAAP